MKTHKLSTLNRTAVSRSFPAFSRKQNGASLIEVLVALFILMFGTLAIINLQTASAISVSTSADHFRINEIGHLIAERLKADSTRAALGDYNTAYEDEAAPATADADIVLVIDEWKSTMARYTPFGKISIECTLDECNIGLQWYESTYKADSDQVYNIKNTDLRIWIFKINSGRMISVRMVLP